MMIGSVRTGIGGGGGLGASTVLGVLQFFPAFGWGKKLSCWHSLFASTVPWLNVFDVVLVTTVQVVRVLLPSNVVNNVVTNL